LNPELTEQEALDLILKAKDQKKSIVVFDFSQIIDMTGNSMADHMNVYYYTDYDMYDELIPILGKRNLIYRMSESCSERKSIFQRFQ